MTHSKLLTTKQVAEKFDVSRDTIHKYKNRGLIEPTTKMGSNDLYEEGYISRMWHIIQSSKPDKTLQEISKDIELLKEEQNLSEDNDFKRILIIEDDKGLVYFYQELFKKCFPDKNLRIYCVEDGLTGVEHAIRIKPHLIILDLALPKKSGESVYRELKYHQNMDNTKFVIVSGNILEKGTIFEDAIFFKKPFNLKKLLNTLHSLIET